MALVQPFQRLIAWIKLLKQFRYSFVLTLHRAEAMVLMKREGGTAYRITNGAGLVSAIE
jgi:hypothetical protein